MIRLLALLLALTMAAPVMAQSGLPPAPYAYRQLDDPAQEARARELMHELRCLVCQGQSIADSDAPMAGDMRSQVRERIAAGQTPDQVRDWLVERYGAWVTYDPPFSSSTALLWLLPLLVLMGGVWLALGRLRTGDDAESPGDTA
jgi:cytochrome c-type biogenesis protein CcmH